jgi:O-antigen ligase
VSTSTDRAASTRGTALWLAPLVTFALASGWLVDPTLALGIVAVVATSMLAAKRLDIAAPVAVALIALVPVYWGRALGGFGLAVIPVTVAAVVLLPGAIEHVRGVRIVGLDIAVGIYLLLRGLAFLLNYSTGAGAAAGFITRVAAAYLLGRLLALLPGLRHRMAAALVLAGGALAIAARFELSRGDNFFFSLMHPSFQATWARPELRFKTLRVEASFGHPIAFGMFLALVVVLSLALAVSPSRRGPAWLYFLISGLALVALLDTLSRGPLLIAAVALVIWVLREHRQVTPSRTIIAAVGLAALLIFSPAILIVNALWASSSGDTREARSATYRIEVASLITDPNQFSLLGQQTVEEGGVTTATSSRVGLKSLDNEYALIFVTGGALSLAAFLVIVLMVWRVVLAPGLDAVDRAWMSALGVSMLGLATVALLTQFSDLFWMSVGIAASIGQGLPQRPDRGELTAEPVRASAP